jgi:FtsP/CotA-like multicopper oxidase with cupredoxin domain
MGRAPWLLAALALMAGCDDDDDDTQETDPPDAGTSRGEPLPEPLQIRSRDGVLETTLTAAPAQITVAGRTFVSNVYDGQYVAPTLRVKRGDQVRLRLVNDIGAADVQVQGPQHTNLHYHGMNISPKAPADDIYLAIPAEEPNDFFDYRWTVPTDHPQGLHWYHPHHHGMAEAQVLSGMSGLLLVEGLIDDHYPELRGIRERQMLLKDIELPGADPDGPKTKTINGLAHALVDMRPGEMQLWEIGHVGADAFFDLQLEGHTFWVLSRDGNPLVKPQQENHLFIPAASRVTVVVRAGAPGDYVLRSLEVDTGPQGDPNPEVVLATVEVRGEPVDSTAMAARLRLPAANLATLGLTPAQVLAMPITRRRTITFSETADGDTFFINGKEFDEDRIDTRVKLGDVEEWTVRNVSGELHVFHIHQLDYLVTQIRGAQQEPLGMRETIDVPFQENGQPGEVKLILPFTNPEMIGKFVYHCHILEHEDNGMMANIEVVE